MRLQARIFNPKKIDRLLIDQELKDGKIVIVQFGDKSYSDKILADLNELCLKYDENFSVRFFGHYLEHFDCKTLLKIPNVKALWLDCMREVSHIEALTELQHLRRLSLGIFELKETEIFQASNFKNLKELIIGDTRTKSLNLKYLENFRDLNSLVISGHSKNIEVIGELTNIETLSLNSSSKVPVGFVNKLRKLKSLHFILGGRENLDEISENEIETLEIVRVRGFNSFHNISNFKKLKHLIIEDQIQLQEFHFPEELLSMEDLKLINCKTLKSLTGINKLKNLKQLRVSKTQIDFEKFITQPFPKSLDILTFYTSKTKIDNAIEERLLKMGYKTRSDR